MTCLPALFTVWLLASLSSLGGGKLGSYLATAEGNRAYARKQYSEALKRYRAAQREDPTGAAPPYNLGTVLYRQRKYDNAIKAFERALNSDDASLQARTYYDIGNCHFRKNDLLKAIESYKKSLQLDPKDAEAKFNLELARRKLKELAQKQQKKQGSQRQQPQQSQSAQGQKGQRKENQQKQDRKQQDKKKPNTAEAQKAKAELSKKGPQQKGQKAKMSQEDARRLLQALAQQEKDARKRAAKQAQLPGEYQVDKDW